MHQVIVDFGKTIGILKKTARKGWISRVGVKNPESVADHSFRSAVLAMCLSDLKGLNTEKMVEMVLLHDVHEALIGDYDNFDKRNIGQAEFKKKEKEAIAHVFSILPQSIVERYVHLAEEYRTGHTKEAKFAREIDQIEMVMQALEYEEEGYDKTKLQEFWDSVETELSDSDIKGIFDVLKQERKRMS